VNATTGPAWMKLPSLPLSCLLGTWEHNQSVHWLDGWTNSFSWVPPVMCGPYPIGQWCLPLSCLDVYVLLCSVDMYGVTDMKGYRTLWQCLSGNYWQWWAISYYDLSDTTTGLWPAVNDWLSEMLYVMAAMWGGYVCPLCEVLLSAMWVFYVWMSY